MTEQKFTPEQIKEMSRHVGKFHGAEGGRKRWEKVTKEERAQWARDLVKIREAKKKALRESMGIDNEDQTS